MLFTAFVSSTASAQTTGIQGFNLLYFKPSVDGSGVLQTVGSATLKKWQVHEGLYLNFNKGLLRRESLQLNGVNPGRDVIGYQFVEDTLLAVGLPGSIDTGLDIPVVFYQRGQTLANLPYANSQLGDIRYFIKWNALKEKENPLGIAIAGNTYIPTGTQALFTGSSETMQDFMLILDKNWENLYVGLNFGYLIAPDDNFNVSTTPLIVQGNGNRYIFSAGVKAPLPIQNKSWFVYSDFIGSWLSKGMSQRNFPAEALLGLTKRFASNIELTAGTNIRVTNALGAPLRRFFLGLTWTADSAKE